MPSFITLERRRSAIALAATALAVFAGPAGFAGAANAEGGTPGLASDPPALTTPAPTTPGAESPAPTTPATPTPTPEPTPTLEPTPKPSPEPALAEAPPVTASTTASAVVFPAPSIVPIAERIAPLKLGPSLRLVSTGKRLRAARLKTLNVKVDVAGASSLKAWVLLPKTAAKAADTGLDRELTLARVSIKHPPSGRLILKFPFNGPGQEALLRFFKVTLQVRIAATDAKGHVTTVDQAITLSD